MMDAEKLEKLKQELASLRCADDPRQPMLANWQIAELFKWLQRTIELAEAKAILNLMGNDHFLATIKLNGTDWEHRIVADRQSIQEQIAELEKGPTPTEAKL